MKKLSLVLVLTMIISIFALGGCGAPEPSPLDGKWIGVGAEMMGFMIPVEEAFGGEFSINILGQGKAEILVGDVSEKDDWELDGDTFTLHMRGADCVGTVNEDVIVFENMLDQGINIIFAREGSGADDPSLYNNVDDIFNALSGESSGGEIQYVPTDKSTFIGSWESMGYSMSPDDPVEHDPEILGYDSVGDLMRLEFKEDDTVHVNFNDNSAENDYQWTVEEGRPYIISEDPIYDLRYRSDDLLEVFITSGDTYMEIYCQRAAN